MRFRAPKYSVWLVSLCILLLMALLPQCVSMHMSDRKIEEYFEGAVNKPSFYEYILNGRKIHYAAMGADTLPMVVFVHGSPGAWDAFISFFKDSSIFHVAKIVSVDRPGFGKSGYGKVETSLEEQAALLMPILKTSKSAKLPLLVAPSIDPALEKWEWYRQIGNSFLVRAIIPKELDVSNRDILPLKEELMKMMPLWQFIRVPVTVIQGEKDKLVPPRNAFFAKKMLMNTSEKVWMIPEMNHFIPWSRPDLIQQAILEFINSN